MRVIGAIILLAILVAAGQGAQHLALRSWNAIVEYRGPLRGPIPRASAPPALSRRVVLVVVDGLREDASRRMPTLDGLRLRGASFVSIVGEPSLSLPGWTTIATGAPQEISGVTTNWYKGAVTVDSLFASAKAAGVRTVVVGSPGWQDLFGRWVTGAVGIKDPPTYTDEAAMHAATATIAETAIRLLDDPARLFVIHLPSPDVAGHGFGGASPQYAGAVQRVDRHLAALLAKVNLATATVVVTADHGHIDTGGHGGWEPVVLRTPLVMAGAGIRPGREGTIRQRDIAPTIALLLGIPIPAHSFGRPVVEALALPPGYTGLAAWTQQIVRAHDAYARAIGARAYASRAGAAAGTGLASADAVTLAAAALDVAQARAREQRLDAERLRRLPVAAGVALLALSYLLLRRRSGWGPAVVGLLAYLVVYAALFFGRGYGWSLSVINTESTLPRFFMERTMDAVAAVAAGGFVAGLFAARRRIGEAALAGLQAAYLIGVALVLQVLYMYWRWDVTFAWYLPDLHTGFKYYLDLLQMIALGYAAAGTPVLAVVGRLIGGLFVPRRPERQVSYAP